MQIYLGSLLDDTKKCILGVQALQSYRQFEILGVVFKAMSSITLPGSCGGRTARERLEGAPYKSSSSALDLVSVLTLKCPPIGPSH